jgi:tetratricopeptide (TPR) repeat protein
VSIDLSQGGRKLNNGDTEGALKFFNEVNDAINPHGMADVDHMRGICLRMLGKYDEAEEAFESAFRLARTRIHQGRIKRDWCMVPLEMGNVERAAKFIDGSLELLAYSETPDPEDHRPQAVQEDERKIEYFVSLGFRCRVDVLAGNVERAILDYETARINLRGRKPYELNTRVWELKIVPFRRRVKLFCRTFWLALQTPNWKRCAQIVLLTFWRQQGLRFDKN